MNHGDRYLVELLIPALYLFPSCQFPVRVSDQLRLSTDRFDLGFMQRGAKRELQVVVLHRDEDNRQERIPVVFSPAADAKTGLQHIRYPVTTRVQGREVTLHITLDVILK